MEDLRQRNSTSKTLSLSGKILGKHSFSLFSVFLREFKPVYKDSRFQRIIWLGLINISSLLVLGNWCNSSQSMGLLSFTYLTVFDLLCLCICALSIWVEQKKPNSQYTFGYERVEVLAVFVSTTFSCTSSFFIIKKSIGRWIQQTQIHTGRLFPGIILAFFCHMLITYCMKNKGLNLVVCASDSSWLQNRMTSVNQSLTHIVPGYSNSSSWPRINPFSLLGCAAGGTLVLALFFIDIYDYHSADAVAGIFISTLNCITMYPISAYSAKILLQGTPPHVTDLLDKCLREASTLDGVLEFRNEHFWLLGFDKIIGTLHVRIRRDANEQIVLSHLLNKLSSLVSDITIQVFKDEWAWSSSTRQILNDSFMKFPPVQETYPLNSGVKVSVSNLKEAVSSSIVSSVSSPSYSYPNVKSVQQPQQSHSYAAIPLPPSLTASKVSANLQNVSINMSGTELVPKTASPSTAEQSKVYQTTYYLQSPSSINKYNRELNINPTFASSPNYMKSYRS